MIIKVLGSGCKKCKQLESNVKAALANTAIEAEVVKVEDMQQIMSYGVMSTPALVVDEQLVSSGKVLKEKEIMKIINK